ncbi:MAG: GspE/PulE family protein [Candidatus Pacebacteria bacterium]|nr:GspE/PulE family protein [Candidatus Paceibacterota bacterium]MCF7862417.1 GspE/PulE family protein [Candidatus Paceibacterota bacterium]
MANIQFDEEKQNKDLEDLRQKEEEELVQLLAEAKYQLPYINLMSVGVDNEALRVITEKEARDLKVAPFRLAGKNLFIAVRAPKEDLISKLTELAERKGLVVSFYMVSEASLNKVWERYAEISMAESETAGTLEISSEILSQTAEKISKMQDIDVLVKELSDQNQVHKVSRILEIVIAGAISIGASDIHIEAEKEAGKIRLRLDGVLHDIMVLDSSLYHLINSRIKLLSGMKLISNRAQDGRFSINEKDVEISIRTSLIPGAYGESIVMRILDPRSIRVKLEDIGIEPFLFSIIETEIAKPNGMILVTGPTGSGKTTTLYAFLNRIYSEEVKIITIEDPIEYHLPGVTQTQTDGTKYTFLEGLRSALRQDPDIVMVGEIRDAETAKIAVESALTGHMVFSTLHTNNAAGVIPRLIDLDVNPKIMVSALSLSLAQRLVRKLCKECKKEKEITEEEKKELGVVLESIKAEGKDLSKYNIDPNAPFKIFTAVGCDKCNMTGYKGRMGIFEAIKTNEEIEKIIPENPSEREIKKTARNQGILTMRQDGIVKILNGVTSIDEVKSVVDLLEE